MGGAAENVLHGRERRLGPAVAPDQAEGPIRDVVAMGEPLVGEAEDHRAGQSLIEDGGELRGENLGLLLAGALAEGVHAVFAQDQRLFAGDVLQARQVIAKDFLVVQVHVETDEVDPARLEIFGGGEIGEGDQAIGRFGLGDLRQTIDEFLHFWSAHEAH